jgi:L-aspartate semialdehyde sulfurtransferase ferredoxin
MIVTKKAYLHFPKNMTDRPFICELIREYGMTVNIFRAKVTPGEGGYLSIELFGEEQQMLRSFDYLREHNVEKRLVYSLHQLHGSLPHSGTACGQPENP